MLKIQKFQVTKEKRTFLKNVENSKIHEKLTRNFMKNKRFRKNNDVNVENSWKTNVSEKVMINVENSLKTNVSEKIMKNGNLLVNIPRVENSFSGSVAREGYLACVHSSQRLQNKLVVYYCRGWKDIKIFATASNGFCRGCKALFWHFFYLKLNVFVCLLVLFLFFFQCVPTLLFFCFFVFFVSYLLDIHIGSIKSVKSVTDILNP